VMHPGTQTLYLQWELHEPMRTKCFHANLKIGETPHPKTEASVVIRPNTVLGDVFTDLWSIWCQMILSLIIREGFHDSRSGMGTQTASRATVMCYVGRWVVGPLYGSNLEGEMTSGFRRTVALHCGKRFRPRGYARWVLSVHTVLALSYINVRRTAAPSYLNIRPRSLHDR